MRRRSFIRSMAFALAATALPEISWPHRDAEAAAKSEFVSILHRVYEDMWASWLELEKALPDPPEPLEGKKFVFALNPTHRMPLAHDQDA